MRIYILLLAVFVPLVTAWTSSTQSDATTIMSLTGMVTFASLLFILTPNDLATAVGSLAVVFLGLIWSGLAPVPQNAGRIELSSAPGVGTRFTVCLPAGFDSDGIEVSTDETIRAA